MRIKDLSHLSQEEFEKAMYEREKEEELSDSDLSAMAERSRQKVMDAFPEIFGKKNEANKELENEWMRS